MQTDTVIWDIINHSFCSFKTKVARERTFCQNEWNVTGLCIKSACPLANSQYATIREEDGVCYLYQKTIERAHTPKNLWEKIKLPANYAKALELVSGQLEHFPKYLVHRNKQRLTKIHQMIIRMRKLKLKARPKIVTENTKVDRREVGKERKALKAAQLDRAIENELLERLKQASDGEIYNYPEREYGQALSRANNKFKDSDGGEEERDVDDEDYEAEGLKDEEKDGEELEEESELDDEDEEFHVEYVEDFEESDDEDEIESAADKLSLSNSSSSNKKRKAGLGNKAGKNNNKGPRVEIEYEHEEEQESAARESNLDF
jgi:protein MAK16